MNDPKTERFGAFFDRVQSERAALRIVNCKFNLHELHGLTESAITVWARSTDRLYPGISGGVSAIYDVLIRLSTRIGALADQSRSVFSEERPSFILTHDILQELDDLCLTLEINNLEQT